MVAGSIHEVAGILGPELATQDLIPIYNSLINDIEDIRVTALNHLSCFVKVSLPLTEFIEFHFDYKSTGQTKQFLCFYYLLGELLKSVCMRRSLLICS